MIAIGEEKRREVAESEWQAGFLAILPQIERHLACAFRRLNPEAREDAIQEGTVNCLKAYVRLCEQGRSEKAFPTTLVRYAVRHINSGRTVGCRLNVRDPLSRYAQIRKRIHVQRLDRYCRESGQWIEAIVEDRRASIPDRVALRIDVPEWLMTLSRRMRQIAIDLAVGGTTTEVAKKHELSYGRISQIRRELHFSWIQFHGEMPDESLALA